jgi:protease I
MITGTGVADSRGTHSVDYMANGKKIAFLVATEGIERVELVDPWDAVKDAGYEPVLLSIADGTVQLFNHLDKADTMPVDLRVSNASLDDYTALVLPGGVANPDQLRMDEDAVAFTRDFLNSGKPVAAICHGPWTLIETGLVRGKRLASWPSLKTDIRNAGGEWLDEQVVVEGNLITSRNPGDIPAFNSALLEAVSHGVSSATAAAV